MHDWRAWECADAAVRKAGGLSLFLNNNKKKDARLLDKKSKFKNVSFKLKTQETVTGLKAEALCLKACESEQICTSLMDNEVNL